MLVDILRKNVYCFEGKELKVGEQEIDDKLAGKLIKCGFAKAVIEEAELVEPKLEVATPKAKAKSTK